MASKLANNHAITLDWSRNSSGDLRLRLGKVATVSFKQNKSTKKWAAKKFHVNGKWDRIQLERDVIRPITAILNGSLILHAALVKNGRRAHLLFADSGTGKSTLTSYLMSHGFEAHSDDMSKVIVTERSASASGIRRTVSLDKKSFKLLGLGEFKGDDQKLSRPLSVKTKVVPLRSILILKRGKQFRIRSASPTEAMSYLLKGSWRPPLRLDSNFPRFLSQVAKLVEMIPCEVVEYPKHKNSLARVKRHLTRTKAKK
jgi:hypothetical protein